MRFLLDRPDGGRRRASDFFKTQSADFQHRDYFLLSPGQGGDQGLEIVLGRARLFPLERIGQNGYGNLAARPAADASIAIDPDAPRDGIDPRQDRLARAIGVANPVDTEPGFLEQIVGLLAIRGLNGEESQ